MLFEEYGFPQGVVDIVADEQEIFSKLDSVIDQDSKLRIQDELKKNSAALKKESEQMWETVFKQLA
jgi:colanic acid/amylovoran biosynthesis protein